MTLTVVAIGGEPATGKSTLVRGVLRFAGDATPFEWGLLKGSLYEDDGLAVFGTYGGEDFDGTDQLSMQVIEDAESFVDEAADPDIDAPTDTILFEGDRLFTDRFLDHCRTHDNVELHAYVLQVTEEELERRHHLRDDDQGGSWLEGRKTKYDRLGDKEWTGRLPNEDADMLEHNAERIAVTAGLVEPLDDDTDTPEPSEDY